MLGLAYIYFDLQEELYMYYSRQSEKLALNIMHCVSTGQQIKFPMQCIVEPHFAYAKTKAQISFAVTTKLIRTFVFATWIVQFLCFLNAKFPDASHLLCLYSLVCVRPDWKSQCFLMAYLCMFQAILEDGECPEVEDIRSSSWFQKMRVSSPVF